MTVEEKKFEMTKRVKEKLDAIDYRINDIISYVVEEKLGPDMTKQKVIITNFTETILFATIGVVSDFDTLEMLYVQTGPRHFVEIEAFFSLDKK